MKLLKFRKSLAKYIRILILDNTLISMGNRHSKKSNHSKIACKSLFAHLLFLLPYLLSAQTWETHFETADSSFPQQIYDRGIAEIKAGVLRTKDAFAVLGDNTWRDYEVTFRARTPAGKEQAQIWAGFRCANRDDRYALALRGGNHDDLYLVRYGWLGTDEMLAIRPLDWHPKPGDWYDFNIRVQGDHFQVYLNDEPLPRINIRDTAMIWSSGAVVLGGSWIENEFDDLKITAISDGSALPYADGAEYTTKESPAQKETRRKETTAHYQPFTLQNWPENTAEYDLSGQWLFAPNRAAPALFGQNAAEPSTISIAADQHLMHVPDFWNENRNWLFGEDAMMLSGDKGQSDNYLQEEIARCERLTFDYKKTDEALYEHWMVLPENTSDLQKAGRKVVLQFDAVAKYATVWWNGHWVGEHVGMFGAFEMDVTPWVRPGKNLLSVRVIRRKPDTQTDEKVADFAESVAVTQQMLKDLPHGIFTKEPAGIWQPVRLVVRNETYLKDVFFQPNLHGATVNLEIAHTGRKLDVFFDLLVSNKIDKEILAEYKDIELNIPAALDPNAAFATAYQIRGVNPQLWSPEQPNLYDLTVVLRDSLRELDRREITVGFRTIEAKGDYLHLNGQPYRLLGANHTPMALCPNDQVLADTFLRRMHDAHLRITRSTVAPFSEVWLQAADRQGVGVSYEGGFPWLMMRGDIPDTALLHLWRDEYLSLIKRYRNHPSILLWTVNNEMKFYEKDTVKARLQQKFNLVSAVVKANRALDPTRPVCFDSGYRRDTVKFGYLFAPAKPENRIDDGDIDDPHTYINWYYFSLFDFFNGKYAQWYKNPGRPLFGQEFSFGYTNSDAGHPPRFYSLVHYIPQALVGRWAYEDHDPAYFLQKNALIGKESIEAIRRSTPEIAGLQAFSSICWFKDVWKADQATPYPTYAAVKTAMQPVLISAELYGRHFYAGSRIPLRFCLLNDAADHTTLLPSKVLWSIVYQGVTLQSGIFAQPSVPPFAQQWDSLLIDLPQQLPQPKINATLRFALLIDGQTVATNAYDILIAQTDWVQGSNRNKRIGLFDPQAQYTAAFQKAGYQPQPIAKITRKTLRLHPLLAIDARQLTKRERRLLRQHIHQGATVLLLHAGAHAQRMFPAAIDSLYKVSGETPLMVMPESPAFDGIEPFDLHWPYNGRRENPIAYRNAYHLHRQPDLTPLLQHTTVHGAINPAFHVIHERVREFTGFPLVALRYGQGKVMLSEMCVEKAEWDPVMGRLLGNLGR